MQRFFNISRQLNKLVNVNSFHRKFSVNNVTQFEKFCNSLLGLFGRTADEIGIKICKKKCASNDEIIKSLYTNISKKQHININERTLPTSLINGFIDWFKKNLPEDRLNPDNNINRNDPDKDENEQENNNSNNKMSTSQRILLLTFGVGLVLYIISHYQNVDRVISFDDFVKELLAKGEVEKIIIRPDQGNIKIRSRQGAIFKGVQLNDLNRNFLLRFTDVEKFEERLRLAEKDLGIKPENCIPLVYNRIENSTKLLTLVTIFVLAMITVLMLFKYPSPGASEMFSGERKANFLRIDLQTKKGKGITFSDVAGLHEAKVEIMEFVDYLKNPDNYKVLGAKIPKGALLLGPPGCGKTFLAKAVANEAKVPFLAMAGSEFVEMLGGLGAARVRDLFKQARSRSPCIVYIDEIDAIGRKRSGDNWSQGTEEEHTLNQLLVEMDGIGTKEGVIVLGSTNRAEVLDKALLRAGRFDRHILIDFPTLKERVEIFEIYLRKLKLKQSVKTYSENLAQMSPGMSGADIANICNEAALHAARVENKSVDVSDFDYAVERVTAGVAKKSRVLSQMEKKVVAYHEAGHALVGWLLEYTNCLLKVSIIPRTSHILGYAQYIPQDRKLHSSEDLFQQMALLLGGRVAESLTFNSVTSGAEDDLKSVTSLAYDQVKLMGMNEKVGLVSYPTSSEYNLKPFSKATASLIDHEARLLVAKVYKFTEKLLTDNKEKLNRVAEALFEKESLNYADMEQLVGPPPYGKKRLNKPISEDGGFKGVYKTK